MNNCTQCGASLREGARFCSQCGAAADNRHICPVCGAQVETGEHFCFRCGAQIPQALPGRDARSAGTKCKAAPDVKGFYKKTPASAVSVSSCALVWSNAQGNLYRLSRKGQLLMAKTGRISILDTLQTPEGLVALVRNYKDSVFELLTLGEDLSIHSRQKLWQYKTLPDVLLHRTFGFLNSQFAAFAWPNRGYSKMHFFRITLSSGKKARFEVSHQAAEVDPLGARVFMTPDGKIFFCCMKRPEAPEGGRDRGVPVWMYVDFASERLGYVQPCPEGEEAPAGKPEFFDPAGDVMWCSRNSPEGETLFPCRISDGAPLPQLPSVPLPPRLAEESGFCYFDGQQAYCDALPPEGDTPPWVCVKLGAVVWPQRGLVISGDDVKWASHSMKGRGTEKILKVLEQPELE